MELIQRTTLHYQEGSSDKIYEVDLCRLAEDTYTVNFRYGRRGTTLKEGTKTKQPISQEKARREFEKLVTSKTKKGYREVSEAASEQSLPTAASSPQDAILRRLVQRDERKWSLNRVIWRAGELGIAEAAPHLIELLGTQTPLRDYCLAAALGRCGDARARQPLQALWQDAQIEEFVKYMAWEALFKLADEATQKQMQQQEMEALPPSLRAVVKTGTLDALKAAFETYLKTEIVVAVDPVVKEFQNWIRNLNWSNWRIDATLRSQIRERIEQLPPQWQQQITPPPDPSTASGYVYWSYYSFDRAVNEDLHRQRSEFYGVIDAFYRINNTLTRSFILDLIARPNSFQDRFLWQRLRHIFKMAEYRQDWPLYTRFAYAFDVTRDRSYRPYSTETRNYLRKRIWRFLKQLGAAKDELYLELAMAILKQYSNADARPPKTAPGYLTKTLGYLVQWDAYADCHLLNHLIYEHSPRYVSHPQAWRCSRNYNPGDAAPEIQEEAFPELWQQRPDLLLELLLESSCDPVREFAAKAMRNCVNFWPQIDDAILLQFFQSEIESIARLGLLILRSRYRRQQPNIALLKGLLMCRYAPARQQARTWIVNHFALFSGDREFLVAIALSPYADIREFAPNFFSQLTLESDFAESLVADILNELLNYTADKTDIITDAGNTLLEAFAVLLRTLNLNLIRNLIASDIPEVQAIGIKILLNHELPATRLPAGLIESLVASPYPLIRGLGVQLFGQLPDEVLLENYDTILAMAISQQADIRQTIRPLIHRLANSYPEFSAQLAAEIITFLLVPESFDNVHTDLLALLTNELRGWMSAIDRETAMQLLRVKSSAAQELGGLALQHNYQTWVQELSTVQIVKLASHEILAVRESAWRMVEAILQSRILNNVREMMSAVRLLEAQWEDSRVFARHLFHALSSEAWSPEVIVTICDSTREDVRQFGRNLAMQFFERDYGQDYLLKFSEHPSADMQVFATHYLEEYAANNLERLGELTPYFITVLSQVNRGRTAKDRIFAFLEKEALKTREAAEVVGEILTRQSLTIAIADKAKAIQIMFKLKQHYPQLTLPLALKAVTLVRH